MESYTSSRFLANEQRADGRSLCVSIAMQVASKLFGIYWSKNVESSPLFGEDKEKGKLGKPEI